MLQAGPGSHRRQLSLLLRRVDSRQGLGRGIDRWGNSPVLLSQYDGFVLFVQPGELIPPGPLGGLYTDAPRGGGLLEGYHPFAWTSFSLSSCSSTGSVGCCSA